jgi:hypothetical protein
LLGLLICVGWVTFFKTGLIGSEKIQAGVVGENAPSRSFFLIQKQTNFTGWMGLPQNRRLVIPARGKEARA